MPKPESRFATVLKVKQLMVKKAQRELAVITVDRQHAEGKLNRLEGTREDAINGDARRTKARAGDVQAGRAFIERLSSQIRAQEKHVEEEKFRESRKRDELVERSQSEEIIERLDRRQRDVVVKQAEKKQQGVIDVVAQRAAGRKQQS